MSSDLVGDPRAFRETNGSRALHSAILAGRDLSCSVIGFLLGSKLGRSALSFGIPSLDIGNVALSRELTFLRRVRGTATGRTGTEELAEFALGASQ
jgi:hypothetical protein